MFAGPDVAAALVAAGVTHIVWIPDSELGTWDAAFAATFGPRLIRVCREGEAFAVAAGLWIGGQKPIVMLQCTGLFEAGDSLRNIVHDLNVPLFFVVGVRSLKALHAGSTSDTCPVFTSPIMDAWKIPYTVLGDDAGVGQLIAEYGRTLDENRAGAVLLPE